MNLLNKLERKFGKLAIKNLMLYIVFANAVVYILSQTSSTFINLLTLNPDRILNGEIWRIITFVFIPPTSLNMFFIIFALYIDYFIGSSLEHAWGTFKFNVYYLIGFLGIIIGSFVTGLSMDNYFLGLSLFFAFAKMFPDYQFVLFFILPVKVKYLGWISWAFFVLSFFSGGLNDKLAIILAICNYFLFFTKDIIMSKKRGAKVIYKRSSDQIKSVKHEDKKKNHHKCTICGRTEQDDSDLEFRYCSKCDGRHEYCMEHLFGHEHIKH